MKQVRDGAGDGRTPPPHARELVLDATCEPGRFPGSEHQRVETPADGESRGHRVLAWVI
jgi:hypothetical protein